MSISILATSLHFRGTVLAGCMDQQKSWLGRLASYRLQSPVPVAGNS